MQPRCYISPNHFPGFWFFRLNCSPAIKRTSKFVWVIVQVRLNDYHCTKPFNIITELLLDICWCSPTMFFPDTKRCVSDVNCDDGNEDSIGVAGVGPMPGSVTVAGSAPGGGGGANSERERDDDFSPLSGAEADRDESGSSHRRRVRAWIPTKTEDLVHQVMKVPYGILPFVFNQLLLR